MRCRTSDDADRALVERIARRVHRSLPRSVELDDLIAYGTIGFLEATARYDPERGIPLSTYAFPRIHGAIMDGLRGMGWLSRRQYARNAAEEAGEDAVWIQLSSDVLDELASLGDRPRVEDLWAGARNRVRLREALGRLTVEEQSLLQAYYGEERTLAEVGRILGLSKSWVCRLHARAVDNLARLVKDPGHAPASCPAHHEPVRRPAHRSQPRRPTHRKHAR